MVDESSGTDLAGAGAATGQQRPDQGAKDDPARGTQDASHERYLLTRPGSARSQVSCEECPLFGADPEQAERQLSQWAQGFADQAERFGAMRAQVEQIQVTESSTDGTVQVTIDSNGAPIHLALTGKISGRSPSEVAALVPACLRRAQRQLAGQVRHAMATTVGAEEPVVEYVVSSYRQRFDEDQPDRQQSDPGLLRLGVIEGDDPPQQRPTRHPRAVPGVSEEDFGDRNYLR
ncbi:MAG: YbaB/EbfC family nucleoid-associated protein [Actinomycetes bacterium]